MKGESGASTLALARSAAKELDKRHRARLDWLGRREEIVRSTEVGQSLASVRARIEQVMTGHAEIAKAYDSLANSLNEKARRFVADARDLSAPPAGGAAASRVDQLVLESSDRAAAAFDLLLEMAQVRAAHADLRLATVLAPQDDPKLSELAGKLTRNAANVGVSLTPVGNVVAIGQGLRKAHDDIRAHVAKPHPVEIEIADGWFGLVDALLKALTGCDIENKLIATQIRDTEAFMKSDWATVTRSP